MRLAWLLLISFLSVSCSTDDSPSLEPQSYQNHDNSLPASRQMELRARSVYPPVLVTETDLNLKQLRDMNGGDDPFEAYRMYLAALNSGNLGLLLKTMSSESKGSYLKKNEQEIEEKFAKADRWLEALELEVTHVFYISETAFIRVQTYGMEGGIRGDSIRFIASFVYEGGVWLNANLHDSPISRLVENEFLGPGDLENNFHDGWVGKMDLDPSATEKTVVKISIVE